MQILKARDRDRAAEGKPPGVYWFDNCVLNQHKFAKLDWNDPEQRQASIDALQYSVRACGTVLLCCTKGPTEAAGWESPAPFARVWCVFEIYVAITKQANIVLQFAPRDAIEFRKALQKDGMARVEKALAELDARAAGASVASDKEMILEEIETTVGVEEVNRRVRERVLAGYRRIAMSAGMR